MSIKGLRQTAKFLPLLVAVVMTIPFAQAQVTAESSGQPPSRYVTSEVPDITERLDAGYWDASGAVADQPVQLPERVLGELSRLAALASAPPPPVRMVALTTAPVTVLNPTNFPDSTIDYIVSLNFPGSESFIKTIISCESRGDSHAVGSAGERGLMQIHPAHSKQMGGSGLIESMGYTWDDMFQPGPNLAVAAALLRSSGWSAWSCAR